VALYLTFSRKGHGGPHLLREILRTALKGERGKEGEDGCGWERGGIRRHGRVGSSRERPTCTKTSLGGRFFWEVSVGGSIAMSRKKRW